MKGVYIVKLILFFQIAFVAPGVSQDDARLMFMKNKYKMVFYYPGDALSFTVKGSDEKITDQIQSFDSDSVIVFAAHRIKVWKIDGVYLDKKNKEWWFLKYKYSKLLLIAGAGYVALDAINSGGIDKRTAIIGGSMIAAGLVAKVLIKERIRLKGRMRLKIIRV